MQNSSLSRFILLVCKLCKVGHYPFGKSGQKPLQDERERANAPTHMCAYSINKTKTPWTSFKAPTRFVNSPALPKRVLCLIKSLLHSHPKAKCVRPVNSHQHGIQYPDIEVRLVEMSKEKNPIRPDEMNRGGVTLFWWEEFVSLICPWSGTRSASLNGKHWVGINTTPKQPAVKGGGSG